jgi:hypothetical protein
VSSGGTIVCEASRMLANLNETNSLPKCTIGSTVML